MDPRLKFLVEANGKINKVYNKSSRRNPFIKVEIYPYNFAGLEDVKSRKKIFSTEAEKTGWTRDDRDDAEINSFKTSIKSLTGSGRFTSNTLPRMILLDNYSSDTLGNILVGYEYKTSMRDNGIGNFKLSFKGKRMDSNFKIAASTGFKVASMVKKGNLFENISLGSLLKVYIDGVFQFSGLIEDIAFNISGAPDKSIEVTGRNVGKILGTQMFYDESDAAILDNGSYVRGRTGDLQGAAEKIGGSILKLSHSILEYWLKKVLQGANFQFSEGTKKGAVTNILSHLDYSELSDENIKKSGLECYLGDYPIYPSLWDYEGPIIGYIKQVISYPFNELYVTQGDSIAPLKTPKQITIGNKEYLTLGKEKMYLVLRKTPFDDMRYMKPTSEMKAHPGTEFNKLSSFVIESDDIINMSLKRSSSECYSRIAFSLVEILTDAQLVDRLVEPSYLPIHLQRFGHNPLNLTLARGESTESLLGTIESSIKAFQDRATQWFAFNDLYVSGSVTHKGFPEIQLGERLLVKSKSLDEINYEFYIEEYSHSWNISSDFKTTTRVSRGLSSSIFDFLNRSDVF